MNRTPLILSALIIGMIATPLYAGPSSKFAAHVKSSGEGMHLLHSGEAIAEVSGVRVETSLTDDKLLHATIKTANKKDLLIGVSLQSGLYTDTTVKGKNGSSEQAGAEAAVKVEVLIDGKMGVAAPDTVIFARRVQELTATLGGVIEKCNVSVDPETGEGEIIIARDCDVSDEEIGLMISTTSANHFNFVAPNMEPGDHTVDVRVTAMSAAEFNNGEYCAEWDVDGNCMSLIETTDNEASAWALVNLGSLTVEEVRGTNNLDNVVIELN